MSDPELKHTGFGSRGVSRRRAGVLANGGEVELTHLENGQMLPLVVQPKMRGINLPVWVQYNLELLESQLLKFGGILFRGFDIKNQTDFQRFVEAFPVKLTPYMEGATPRVEVGDKVYTSTEFPPDQSISIHNELCYVMTWPMKIWFCCLQPAERGGETPIGDVRNVFNRIPPGIRDRFVEKGWMLVRNFREGFGLTWQTSYRVDDRAALEKYFNEAAIEYEWNGNDHLRTWQVRPAVTRHPKTGESVWFNHIGFWHVSSLQPQLRELFLEEFGERGLPYNTYYGDGSPIEASVIEELRQAYEKETVAFPWQQGDIIMLDNMLVAHGRNPYAGPRKVLVSMGEPFSRERC